jgi:hypothetical protein
MPRVTARSAALLGPSAGLLAWIVAASALAQAPGDRPWGVEERVNGCQVSTRAVPGRDYVAARTSCVVPADLEAIAMVLRDVERYPEWMEDCAQTKVLNVVDRERDVLEFWYRQRVAVFADRDMVLRTEVPVHEPDRRVIRASTAASARYDAGEGFVRMPSFSAEWVLERLAGRQTRVTFTIDPDLGPGLPIAVANSVIAKTPLRSIQHGLARMARRPEYVERARAATARKAIPADARAAGPGLADAREGRPRRE